MKQIVLSLFPGGGLLDKAFTEVGFFVVRGPDGLHGGDNREFDIPPGFFDGIIGGPPCQIFSKAKGATATSAINLIPDFLRCVDQGKPQWAMMENVTEALPFMESVTSNWDYVEVRDYDVGGRTNRTRGFWFKGVLPPPAPERKAGRPAQSVLASSWKYRPHKEGMHSAIDLNVAAELQGYPLLGHKMLLGLPDAIPPVAKARFATHMLGNGVPRAMGLYVAEWVRRMTQ